MVLKTLLNGRLIIETGDITEKKVDAVVNAANSSLMGGGGVDGAIHRKGGTSILKECKKIRKEKYPDGLPAGEAVYTKAGNLPAQYVIHTVGPIWYGGKKNEKKLLQKAYISSLNCAKELNLMTIAFPAISTGVYGYPKEEAAQAVYEIIDKYTKKNSNPREIFLVFFNKHDADIFLKNI